MRITTYLLNCSQIIQNIFLLHVSKDDCCQAWQQVVNNKHSVFLYLILNRGYGQIKPDLHFYRVLRAVCASSVLCDSIIFQFWLIATLQRGSCYAEMVVPILTEIPGCIPPISFTALCNAKHKQLLLQSPGHICRIPRGSGEWHVPNARLQAWQVKFWCFWCNPKLLLKSSSEQDQLICCNGKSWRSGFRVTSSLASLTFLTGRAGVVGANLALALGLKQWLCFMDLAEGVFTPTF